MNRFISAIPELIMATLIFGVAAFSSDYKQIDRVYSLSTVVTAIDKANDTVTVTDFNGNDWQFTGVEDWFVGDICALTMDNMATDEIFDDEIINCKYCGWIEDETV